MDIENHIIEKVIKGDATAFEYVYKQYYDPLVAFATRFVPDEAKEVVQDTLLKIWEMRSELKNVKSLKSYLYRTVRNTCLNHIKRQGIHDRYVSEAMCQLKMLELSAMDDEETDSRSKKVAQLIEQIPEQRRKVFLMNVAGGLKAKEISEQLDISERTVHTHVYKAMKFLREKLQIGIMLVPILLSWLYY